MKYWIAIFVVIWSAACVSDPPSAGPAVGLDAGTSGNDGSTGADTTGDAEVPDGGECACLDSEGPDNSTGVCDDSGECIYECNDGYFLCQGECVEPQTDASACGVCPVVDCTASLPEGTNAICQRDEDGFPGCLLECPDGFQDENELLSDGCECPTGDVDFTTATLPLECARVANSIVYVDPSAAAAGDGLAPDTPLTLLGDAVLIARQQERRTILLKSGTLGPDNVSIDGGGGALEIYGGRSSEWGATTNTTTLPALDVDSPTLEVSGFALSDKLTLKNLRVTQGEATEGASVTMRVASVRQDGIEFENFVVEGGVGAAAAPALKGTDGGHGGHGGDGIAGTASASSGPNGGAAGSSPCSALGGQGGAVVVPTSCNPTTPTKSGIGAPGLTSSGDLSVSGGMGGDNFCANETPDSGKFGTNGEMGKQTGDPPDHGGISSDQTGSFNADGTVWTGSPASGGGKGPDGSGGSGGGAGGSVVINLGVTSTYNTGSSGGGGGGGGCGGAGGAGGTAGGDSIAVVLADSDVDLAGMTIVRGNGGAGGKGGDGGCGGAGGDGGDGKPVSSGLGGGSGSGMPGGAGLGGSGGAGGNGGSTVGVGLIASSTTNDPDQISGGIGGVGGAGGKRGGQAQYTAGGTATTCAGTMGDNAERGAEGDVFDVRTF